MTAAGVVPDVVTVFRALGDPTRQQLMAALGDGPRASAELSSLVGTSRQAVEKQLRLLAEAGLVATEREGRRVAYTVRTAPLDDAAGWLRDRSAEWDRQLRLLKDAAETRDA